MSLKRYEMRLLQHFLHSLRTELAYIMIRYSASYLEFKE